MGAISKLMMSRRGRAVALCLTMTGLSVFPDLASAVIYDEIVGASSARQETKLDWELELSASLSAVDKAKGMCVDSFFDWNVVDANAAVRHYDARVVRNCDVGFLWRGKWVDDPIGLTLTGPRKIGSCLVIGTDAAGRWGSRVGCQILLGKQVAPCGSTSAACFIRKNGLTLKTGWSFPQSSSL